jgi:hypothetical protein
MYSGAGLAATGLLLSGCSDDAGEMAVENPSLQPPANFQAIKDSSGSVKLSWKDQSSGESGYRVERSSTPNGTFTQIGGDLRANTTSFTDVGVGSATVYYRVRAFQGTQVSAYTNVMSSNNMAATVYLGEGDIGILNYAYALEQLEAAYYIMAVQNFYGGASDNEMRVLDDLRKHEVAHRDFFKAALGDDAIPDLMVDFSSVDFGSRMSVLGTAKVLENTGVSAYNGAGPLLMNTEFLTQAGKIVSVEARHAAVISNLIEPNSTAFVDVVDEQGLDLFAQPMEVLMAAGPFITTEIDASGLPTEEDARNR